MLENLRNQISEAATAAAESFDEMRGATPYAARLAKASVKAGPLLGLGANRQWQRRYFVLKPTTMLYYFGSPQDEEPLGCLDVEAFTTVACRDVDVDGAVTIELARAGPSPDDAPVVFSLKSSGEAEGYAWIEALKRESSLAAARKLRTRRRRRRGRVAAPPRGCRVDNSEGRGRGPAAGVPRGYFEGRGRGPAGGVPRG